MSVVWNYTPVLVHYLQSMITRTIRDMASRDNANIIFEKASQRNIYKKGRRLVRLYFVLFLYLVAKLVL